MRVMMVLDAPFPPDPRVEKEAETLVQAGHEVHLLCYTFDRRQSLEEAVKGIHVIRKYFPRFLARKALGLIFYFPVYTWWWRRFLTTAIRRYQPDVIHTHDLPLGLPVSLAIMGNAQKRPRFVLDLHENYPDLQREGTNATQFPQRLLFSFDRWFQLEKELVLAADHIVVINEANRDRLRAVHETNKPVTVVRNTIKINPDETVRPGVEVTSYFRSDRINLLYIGGLDRTRGLETVLEGLARMGDAGTRYHLVFAGSGSYRGELEGLAQRLGLISQVVFPGFVQPKQFGEFCVSTDICLLPLKRTLNTEHADPNKLYQYVFWAKPVLASGTQTVHELVTEMQCGVTYEPDDPDSFARSLQVLTDQRERWADYGRNGRKRVLDTYNWDVTARKLVEMYDTIGKELTAGQAGC